MITRRGFMQATALGLTAGLTYPVSAAPQTFQLATFMAEVTPPIGHPCMGGGIAPIAKVEDPLFVHGLIFLGEGKPIVVASVDWCEIRNEAYDRWRGALAEAAGTSPDRVLVTCIHQHDAPVADLEAERILKKANAKGSVCDLEFHEKTVKRVADAAATAMKAPRKITHVGMGQAEVEKVASNRRYLGPDGKPRFGRTSATRDPAIRDQPEGTIDPWLKALSFWDGDKPVAVISGYATHPMSYYGKGGASADFPGIARKRRQADEATVFQVYVNGAAGNVTAGKFNDGSPDNRAILADRIYKAMVAASKATRTQPLTKIDFRSTAVRLEPRDEPGFTVRDMKDTVANNPKPFAQCLAAMGLSWRQRADAGQKIDLPVIDFGPALMVLLPGESYIEYQLLAQKLRPDAFVLAMGYGECATGYVPTEKAVEERDSNLTDWCWVAPGAEKALTAGLEKVLKPGK